MGADLAKDRFVYNSKEDFLWLLTCKILFFNDFILYSIFHFLYCFDFLSHLLTEINNKVFVSFKVLSFC